MGGKITCRIKLKPRPLNATERDTNVCASKSRVLRYEVEQHLAKGWTPELISGQFRKFRLDLPPVNTESIYQWIYAEALHLIGYLPRSHKERFPRRKGRKTRRAALQNHLAPPPPHPRRSITYDNGTENAEHQILNQALKTKSFFRAPYHSWEKGTVENRNGLVRRFFPKRCDFDTIPNHQIQQVEDWINNRPMKCLGFKSPRQVFDALVALTP